MAFFILFYELIFEAQKKQFRQTWALKAWDYHTPALHFLLGGLLSAYAIFYFKSASLATSLLFIGLLAALLIANELPRFQSLGLQFRIALLALCSLSFMVYVIPILLGQLGFFTFILSLLVSLGLFLSLWYLLKKKGVERGFLKTKWLVPMLFVHVLFLGLYLLKAIPPVPLAMTHIGIYHKVEKFKGKYQLLFDKPWWKFWRQGSQDFIAQKGDRVYLFTKIFSPTHFKEKIYAHWQFYSDNSGWKTSDKIPIEIQGGREEGFRGYSYKSHYHPGEWRILVETSDGREVGRIYFNLTPSSSQSFRHFQNEWH